MGDYAVKHIGFQLNLSKPVDSKCADILSNLPRGENICSYIRKAIIFYNKNNGALSDKASNMTSDEKLDLILSRLDILGSGTESVVMAAAPEKESETKDKKPEKKKKKVEVKEEKEEKIQYEVPKEDPNRLSIDATSELDSDNFDELMGDFLNS